MSALLKPSQQRLVQPKNEGMGTAEVVQQLRVCPALTEDPVQLTEPT